MRESENGKEYGAEASGETKRSLLAIRLTGIAVAILLVGLSFLLRNETERGSGYAKMPGLGAVQPGGQEPEGTLLWQLGEQDGSSAEFAEPGAKGTQAVVQAGGNARQAASAASVSSGLDASELPEFTVAYELPEVPEHGVLFRVNILDAYKSTPQMSVFSNGQLSGIIQIAGLSDSGSEFPFRKSYELYIPKEQLREGANELRMGTLTCLYCSEAETDYLWWTWDSLSLTELTAPIGEPIHGSYVLSGTTVNNKQFYFDKAATEHLPYVIKWLGLAYSGNIMRASCASDVGNSCSDMENYYKELQKYNMQSVVLYLHTGDIVLNEDGSLPDTAVQKLENYFASYGKYFQYYEVDNEPGLFNRSKEVNLAIAEWLNERGKEMAPHMKTVAPGWAYWPEFRENSCGNQRQGEAQRCGDPDGWERDAEQRLELEQVTDLTNGHSYGESYLFAEGGSFTENLRTFGGSENGLPKTMLSTEFGTSDSHYDPERYGASQPKAAVFDRIMRSHIGYAEMFIQHAAFFKDFTLFKTGFSLEGHDPASTEIYYVDEEQESRVSIMRRLNLAYATHGAPLSYTVDNIEELENKLVYVRAVDTSTLDPLPGSNATSNKILINFVNFESTEQTVTATVTLPQNTTYEGERFGNGDTYAEARSYVSGLEASPQLTFTETLQPGEGVQYMLQPSSEVAKEAPGRLTAEAVRGPGLKLSWLEAAGASYEVLRASGSNELKVIGTVEGTAYTDENLREGDVYRYAVRVKDGPLSEEVRATATGLLPLDRTVWTLSSNINNSPAALGRAIDGDRTTRWETGKHQAGGEWIQIDLGGRHTVEAMELLYEASPYDHPRAYKVELSDDGRNWRQAASGHGLQERTYIPFSASPARHVRITQTGSGGNYWSVHELQIYSRD